MRSRQLFYTRALIVSKQLGIALSARAGPCGDFQGRRRQTISARPIVQHTEAIRYVRRPTRVIWTRRFVKQLRKMFTSTKRDSPSVHRALHIRLDALSTAWNARVYYDKILFVHRRYSGLPAYYNPSINTSRRLRSSVNRKTDTRVGHTSPKIRDPRGKRIQKRCVLRPRALVRRGIRSVRRHSSDTFQNNMNGRVFLCLACVFAMRVAARDPKSPSLRSAVDQDHDREHDDDDDDEDSPARSRRFIIGMPAKRARDDDPSERLVLGRDGWYRPVFKEQPENDVYDDDVADYYTSSTQPPMSNIKRVHYAFFFFFFLKFSTTTFCHFGSAEILEDVFSNAFGPRKTSFGVANGECQ